MPADPVRKIFWPLNAACAYACYPAFRDSSLICSGNCWGVINVSASITGPDCWFKVSFIRGHFASGCSWFHSCLWSDGGTWRVLKNWSIQCYAERSGAWSGLSRAGAISPNRLTWIGLVLAVGTGAAGSILLSLQICTIELPYASTFAFPIPVIIRSCAKVRGLIRTISSNTLFENTWNAGLSNSRALSSRNFFN